MKTSPRIFKHARRSFGAPTSDREKQLQLELKEEMKKQNLSMIAELKKMQSEQFSKFLNQQKESSNKLREGVDEMIKKEFELEKQYQLVFQREMHKFEVERKIQYQLKFKEEMIAELKKVQSEQFLNQQNESDKKLREGVDEMVKKELELEKQYQLDIKKEMRKQNSSVIAELKEMQTEQFGKFLNKQKESENKFREGAIEMLKTELEREKQFQLEFNDDMKKQNLSMITELKELQTEQFSKFLNKQKEFENRFKEEIKEMIKYDFNTKLINFEREIKKTQLQQAAEMKNQQKQILQQNDQKNKKMYDSLLKEIKDDNKQKFEIQNNKIENFMSTKNKAK